VDRASANAASHRLSRRDLARRCEARQATRRVLGEGDCQARRELGKRVSPEERRKLETALAARVPKLGSEEAAIISASSSAGSARWRRSRRWQDEIHERGRGSLSLVDRNSIQYSKRVPRHVNQFYPGH